MSFWVELKRRNVGKVGLAYAVAAWLVIQLVTTVMPTFDAPDWVAQTITFLVVLLFPFVLIFAWVFELTPQGLRKTEEVPVEQSIAHVTSQRLNYVIASLLLIAIGLVAVDRFLLGAPTSNQQPAASVEVPATVEPAIADAQPLPNSVAVIPFANLSPRQEDSYFAAGIHDEILNQLVKLQSLNVIARTSVLQYAGTSKTIPEIGRELNVENVMEGSVRYADGRVLVTAQLIDVRTNSHVWADSYEREFANIFAIQADVAMNVANALEAEFTPSEQVSLEQLPTASLEAYELYLAAQDQARAGSRTLALRGLQSLDEALALDPRFARAWVMKAGLTTTISQAAPAARYAELQRDSLEAANRAAEIDPDLVEAQALLAAARSRTADWIEAERAFRRADKAGAAATAGLYGLHLHSVGHTARAHELISIDRRTDPRNASRRGFYILGFALLGDTERVDVEYDRAKAVFGEQSLVNWFVALARLTRGAPTSLERIPPFGADTIHGAAREHLSAPAQGLAMLRERYAAASDPQISQLLEVAVWSAYFGDAELALEALERATRLNAQNAVHFWLPSMREVRQLPRFAAFMREIGLVDYWREFGYPLLCRPAGTNGLECN